VCNQAAHRKKRGTFSVQYPVQAELVKLRYFAGMTNEEASQPLGISLAPCCSDKSKPDNPSFFCDELEFSRWILAYLHEGLNEDKRYCENEEGCLHE
jgi:hypothetical protein